VRVLVVDDERALADYVAGGLRRAGFAVDLCYDGAGALERLAVTTYDVLVLDRNLPDVSGDEVCRETTGRGGRTRILMLTAAAAIRDLVEGLQLGADDYLVKPFDYDELVARVHALSRRARPASPPVLSWDGLVLDVARREAARNGVPLQLTRKEFAVLEILLLAGGEVVSAEDLLERAWDENADPFTSAVRVTISKLRAKLGDPPIVRTVAGVGYRV
jgi:DNA-binding response OmpR family regulator